MNSITMAMGDIEQVGFCIRDETGEPIDFTPEEIYFTVKRSTKEKPLIFLKNSDMEGI